MSGVPAAAAHAFVADLERPSLEAADAHHLARVLRVRPGTTITVSDGRGGWRLASFGDPVEPVGPITRAPRPAPPIVVAFAVPKGDRAEWLVQKCVELGVDVLVPMTCARSVVRWEAERGAHHLERLRRVAREAAVQSRRTWLPEVEPVADFAAVAARPGAMLADSAGDPPRLPAGPVLVGPEGGWDDAERVLGLPAVTLARQVLRVETAAVAATTLLGALRGGLLHEIT